VRHGHRGPGVRPRGCDAVVLERPGRRPRRHPPGTRTSRSSRPWAWTILPYSARPWRHRPRQGRGHAPGMPAVSGPQPPEAMAVLRARAREIGAPFMTGQRLWARPRGSRRCGPGVGSGCVCLWPRHEPRAPGKGENTPARLFRNLPLPARGLPAPPPGRPPGCGAPGCPFRPWPGTTSAKTPLALAPGRRWPAPGAGLRTPRLPRGIGAARLPGRLQRVPGGPGRAELWLDGAHNVPALERLARAVGPRRAPARAVIFACMPTRIWRPWRPWWPG
jgi:hypothetical protein